MGTSQRRERFETSSGIELERLYGPGEADVDYDPEGTETVLMTLVASDNYAIGSPTSATTSGGCGMPRWSR